MRGDDDAAADAAANPADAAGAKDDDGITLPAMSDEKQLRLCFFDLEICFLSPPCAHFSAPDCSQTGTCTTFMVQTAPNLIDKELVNDSKMLLKTAIAIHWSELSLDSKEFVFPKSPPHHTTLQLSAGAIYAGWAHSLLFGAEFGTLKAQLPAKLLEDFSVACFFWKLWISG